MLLFQAGWVGARGVLMGFIMLLFQAGWVGAHGVLLGFIMLSDVINAVAWQSSWSGCSSSNVLLGFIMLLGSKPG
jgi:hypothetical protein